MEPLATLRAAAQAGQVAQPLRLTLCGERASATFTSGPRSLIRTLKARFAAPAWLPLLETL